MLSLSYRGGLKQLNEYHITCSMICISLSVLFVSNLSSSQITLVASEEIKKFKWLNIAGQFSVEVASEKLLFTRNIVFGGS